MSIVEFIVNQGKSLLRRSGLVLKKAPVPIYAELAVVKQAIRITQGHTMLSETSCVSLADQIVYCNRAEIAGSFVECGVWKGGAVGLMAYVSRATGNTDRALHLFDAFQDICAPNPEVDGERALSESARYGEYQRDKVVVLTGIYDSLGGHGSVEACREVVVGKAGYPEDKVHFHVGWFQDTVQEASARIGPIALLRLDGDWYESTKTCLEGLYDNVVPGGIVILDDYLAYEGCRRATDEFMKGRNIKAFLTRADTSACYFIKPE